MTDSLSPAGSSTYDSSTLYVGDGTWDSTKNDFLLPNLVGLNFATMQYNGMKNRFAGLSEYHVLILGHGVLAALTFLLVVPSAIFIARFYYANPRLALRLHIYLHILTVGLVTVVLILGWLAVGPERSLTNPHHGIGVALYTLILVQAIGGALVHRIEKGKVRWKIPLKLMLHQWFGRAIAILGVVQIPLGLTLYGSPKSLFVLYALAVFAWVLLYFILSYIYQGTRESSEYGSYVSQRTRTELTGDGQNRQSGHFWRNTALFGGGLAAYHSWRKSRDERKEQQREEKAHKEIMHDAPGSSYVAPGTYAPPGTNAPGHYAAQDPYGAQGSNAPGRYAAQDTYTPQGSRVGEEKMTEESLHDRDTWRDRVLAGTGALAAYEGARRFFSRRRRRDDESDGGSYGPVNSSPRRNDRLGHNPQDGQDDVSVIGSNPELSRRRPQNAPPQQPNEPLPIPPPGPYSTMAGQHTGTYPPPPVNPPYPDTSGQNNGSYPPLSTVEYPATAGQNNDTNPYRPPEPYATMAGHNTATVVASAPMSVKVRMHDDGRHVTVRRVNEDQAAADREAQRNERAQRRRRQSSTSSAHAPITNVPPPPTMLNYRPDRPDELNLPPTPMGAPPVPTHYSPQAPTVTSPSQQPLYGSGMTSGTGTDFSAFDDNRKRRRAERAAARQRAAQQGSRVTFT